MDRIDKIEGGSVFTLDCLLGQPSEHSRPIFAEEQEIACLQLAWLAFRTEMKFYENKNEQDSFWIRSDLNDKLARDIEMEHQIDEIEFKMPKIKEMLNYQIRVAEELGVTHTAEFEEANRKIMELNIIEDRLEKRREEIQKVTRRYICGILLLGILLIPMLVYVIYFAKKEPNVTFED